MSDDFLIVGLGNPGSKYEKTRHNLGFMVVEAFAGKYGLSFSRNVRLKGKAASGICEGKKVHLLKPSTYMNLSGEAVRKTVQYYKIALDHILIVVDDVYLKLGALRLRLKGSAGGHNGLKNIEECLHTQEYPRLRLGVGSEEGVPNGLEEYVLANFNPTEQKMLPEVIEKGVSAVESWLTDKGEYERT